MHSHRTQAVTRPHGQAWTDTMTNVDATRRDATRRDAINLRMNIFATYKWVNDDKSRTKAVQVYEKHFNLISELIKMPQQK